jgi:hypothetical protein
VGSAADIKPLTKDVDRALGEATGAIEPTAEKVVGPAIEKAADPLIGAAKETAEPVLGATSPIIKPVVDAATPVTERVTEPVLGAATPIVSPLNGALNGAIGPVAEPLLRSASPITTESPLEGMPSSVLQPAAFEPALESAAPIYDGAIEPAAGGPVPPGLIAPAEGVGLQPAAFEPALEPIVGGEGNTPLLLGNGEVPDLALLPVPASASESVSLAPTSAAADAAVLGADTSGTSTAVDTSSGTLASSVARSLEGTLFGGSFSAVTNAAANAAAVMVNGAQEDGAPLLPLGFPNGAPVGSSAFGGSGFGIGLELLAALALLSLLPRLAESSRSPRDLLRPVSTFRPVAELPG